MFEPQELQALHQLLNRTQLSGEEADTVVYLKNKIKGELEDADVSLEPDSEEDADTDAEDTE